MRWRIARRIVGQPRTGRKQLGVATRAAGASRATIRRRLYGIVPADARKPFDVREVIARIVDGSRVRRVQGALRHDAGLRLRPHLRLSRSASSPTTASCSRNRALKGAHFIELCCQRGIPLVFLQNITGFMVGRKYEAGGIAKDGAKLVTAVACARCRSSRSSIGGCFGAGNYGMCGRAYSPALPVDVAERAHLGDGRRAGGERAGDRSGATAWRRRARPGRAEDEEAFKAPIRDQYERQGHPYYATRAAVGRRHHRSGRDARRAGPRRSRPRSMRRSSETRFGVFRM